jgi:RNA polymerase sigma factor (sigma-70 family)
MYDNDVLLWGLFKQGDWNAYTELYNQYFKLLNNYGYKFTRDTNIIEDAVHDLFIKLWTNRGQLSTPVSVKHYLYKSLRNIIFRKIQSQSRFVDFDNEEYPFNFEISFDNTYIANEEEQILQTQIKNVLQTLPARQQEIIYLRFYEGISYEEIAEIMSINVTSAYKLLYKALNSLQVTLKTPKIIVMLAIITYFKDNLEVNRLFFEMKG